MKTAEEHNHKEYYNKDCVACQKWIKEENMKQKQHKHCPLCNNNFKQTIKNNLNIWKCNNCGYTTSTIHIQTEEEWIKENKEEGKENNE